jgi:glycosyltransferase involved in cell wall biosynthesis
MASKKIVMGCGHYWGSPFRIGTHHLAKGFVSKGWEVAFISSPISPLHAFSSNREELNDRLAIYRGGGTRFLDGMLWAYVPGAVLTPTNKPVLRSGWVCNNWHLLTVPPLGRQLAKNGFGDVDVVYFDNPSPSGLLDVVRHRRSVYRIADKMGGFKHFPKPLLKMEKELAGRVDLVVYSAGTLAPHIESLGPKNSMLLPNGVDFGHFNGGSRSLPQEYAGLKGPIAVYVGAMEEWFDFDLVSKTAADMPGVEFVLIGPDRLARERLSRAPNIHLLGPRPFSRLPEYLYNAAVGLIPFDAEGHAELVNTVNPLKLYEYMACGLPVVSAEWRELKEQKSPALLYSRRADFRGMIAMAIDAGQDRGALVEFARQADWGSRVEQLIKRLEETG